MNNETKFNVGQKVYLVSNYLIIKCVIKEVIIKKTDKGTFVEYTINPTKFEDRNEQKYRNYSESYLVEDFQVALKVARENAKNIYENLIKQYDSFTEDNIDEKISE